MKRILFIISLFFYLLQISTVFGKNNDEWKEKPVITHLYELSKEKIFLEWDGNADLYQIIVDGNNISTVNIEYTIFDLKSGPHQISVMPVSYNQRDVDSNLGLELSVGGDDESEEGLLPELLAKFGKIGKVGASFNLNLAALGIKYEDLIQGNPSDNLQIKYNASSIVDATPEIINAFTDFDDNIHIVFLDKYDSDNYQITIKSGKDTNYVEFASSNDDACNLISKDKSTVTIILDSNYLKDQGCMIPELDQKYGFSVKLQKCPVDYVRGEKVMPAILESKESKTFEYIPYPAWKNAPTINSASQTGEGQVILQWNHDDNGLGCEYQILKYDMLVMVKKGEEEIGRTTEKEFTIDDLMNGKYTYAVVPVLDAVHGFVSEPVTVEIKNNWEITPSFEIENGDNKQATLKWKSAGGVDQYHIRVFVSNKSLLSKVSLDFKLLEEIDVPFKSGNMEYIYDFSKIESGAKLKFEIYGLRHTANGDDQKTETGSQTITVE